MEFTNRALGALKVLSLEALDFRILNEGCLTRCFIGGESYHISCCTCLMSVRIMLSSFIRVLYDMYVINFLETNSILLHILMYNLYPFVH